MRERKELEDQLRHAHKMKSLGTLAGGIAHDFNNILQIILLNTSRLKDSERVDSGRLAKVVEVNEQAIQRGTELVRQILTFARKTDVTFTVFKLQDFFPKFLMMMKETFPRTINFDLKQNPELPPIFADQNQINQVFLNLCVNARDAMPEGGTIAIQYELRDGTLVKQRFDNAVETYYVCITLSDTGSGMDQSTLARIYEPFFTTKDPGKGTGLGLAVVYGIIEGHQGFLDVKSTVDVGTTFSIYLPLSKTHMVSPEEINGEVLANSRGDETILVIEDEPYLLETLCSLLHVQGYRVIPASDGYEAVEIYRDRHDDIALVITDLGLPKLNGWDAFLRMKEINPNVRTIISTGYMDPKMKEEKTEPGIVDFIQKPYRPATILRSVRKVLNEKNSAYSLPVQS
jgi:nitrogen-specific signal transduction histidine kinase/ActR/RegA family two-component response regulator